MIGVWLGGAIFVVTFAAGFILNQAFSTIVFRSCTGFALFYLIGFALEKIWVKLGDNQSGGGGTEETAPSGKLDLTFGAEIPNMFVPPGIDAKEDGK